MTLQLPNDRPSYIRPIKPTPNLGFVEQCIAAIALPLGIAGCFAVIFLIDCLIH